MYDHSSRHIAIDKKKKPSVARRTRSGNVIWAVYMGDRVVVLRINSAQGAGTGA